MVASIAANAAPVGNIASLVQGMNPDELINPIYQDLTVMEFVKEIVTAKPETLGDYNNYFPIIESKIKGEVNDFLRQQMYFEFDWEELKIKPFVQSTSGRADVDQNEILMDYVPRAIKQGLLLKNFLLSEAQKAETNPGFDDITFFLAYPLVGEGDEMHFDVDHPYSIYDVMSTDGFANTVIDNVKAKVTIRAFLSQEDIAANEILTFLADTSLDGLSDKIKSATIGDIMAIDDSSSPVLKYLADATLDPDSPNYITKKIDDATIGNIFGIDAQNPSENEILNVLKDAKLNEDDIVNALKDATVGQLLGIDDLHPTDNIILDYLKDAKLSEEALSEKMNNATIGDLIEIDPADPNTNKILIYLKDTKLDEDSITAKIDDATLIDVLDIQEGDMLYGIKDSKINQLEDSIGDLKLSDVMNISSTDSKILQKIKEDGVLVKDVSAYISDATLDMFLEYDPTHPEDYSPIIRFLCTNEVKLTNFEDKINNALISQLVDIEDTSPQVLKYLGTKKLNEVSTAVENMTVADAFAPEDLVEGKPLYPLSGVKVTQIQDNIGLIQLKDVLTISSTSPKIVSYLATATKAGNPITINDLDYAIDNMTLGDAIDIDSSDVLYELRGYPVMEIGDHIGEIQLGKAFDVDESSPQILKFIANGTVGGNPVTIDNVDQLINTAKLKDVIKIDSSSPQLLVSLQDENINDLGSAIKTKTLGDMIEINSSSPRVMQVLADCTLYDYDGNTHTTVEDKLNNLKFNEVFTEDDVNSSTIMKALWNTTKTDTVPGGDFSVYDISSQLNLVKIADAFGDEIYDTSKPTFTYLGKEYKYIKDTWWLLLTETGPSGSPTDDDNYYAAHPDHKNYVLHSGASYTLGNDLGKLVDNMNNHIQNDSVQSLIDAEFISITPANVTKLELILSYYGKTLDDVSISQLLDIVINAVP